MSYAIARCDFLRSYVEVDSVDAVTNEALVHTILGWTIVPADTLRFE